MRVCDKCLKKLTGNKVFHINIESYDNIGRCINSECKSYEICEDCISKVQTLLQTTDDQEADK